MNDHLNLYAYYGPKSIISNSYVIQIDDNLVLKINKDTFKVVGHDYYGMWAFGATWKYLL